MRILVLTSVYPQPDDMKDSGTTPVVHFFAKEWVKMGHEVIVIHNANKYPGMFYWLPNSIHGKIKARLGIVLPTKKQGKKLEYIKDGVKIFRLPILKVIPYGGFLKTQLKKQYLNIVEVLKSKKFEPDLIIGHWENPQIPLVSMLKKNFNARTAIVFHGINYLNRKQFSNWRESYMKDIDLLGFRCKGIQKQLKKVWKYNKKEFICYSGLPNEYIEEYGNKDNAEDVINKKRKFIYVGRLIQRKYVDKIIEGLAETFNKDFELDIVGIGNEKKNLEKIANEKKVKKQVKFHGVMSREEVLELMKQNECFTMISKDEAFGLVYLEAMLQGCIVIGSKNEGIDGIIINGENGFLCEAGNKEELKKIYNNIENMTVEEKKELRIRSINTANKFSDSYVAQHYIDSIVNHD